MKNALLPVLNADFHFAFHVSDIEDESITHYARHRDRKASRDFDESHLGIRQ